MKICIIGKSKRLEVLKKNLINKGYDAFQLTSADVIPNIIDANFVVLPIPTLIRSGKLNLDNCPDDYTINTLINKISRDSVIISCNYSNDMHRIIDINTREDFVYLNAVPTAEGAIHAAVENCDYSLFYGQILITGFGRVSKILSDRLKGLKCNVTIAARSLKDLSYARALGFNTVDIRKLEDYISDFDLVFQTVPSLIIDKNIIDCMKKETIVVELSSKSIGTDYEYAKSAEITVIHALALPEKVAPLTAGNILTESVLSIIAECQADG